MILLPYILYNVFAFVIPGMSKREKRLLKSKWRYAVAGSFIAAWLISPGATGGLIEAAMGLIFSGLYFSGIYLGKFMEVRKRSYVYVEA